VSTALAIAGVSAVLRDLLINGLIDQDLVPTLGDVSVTAMAPDRVRPPDESGPSQLNVFLYRATPNLGWRNVGNPAYDSRGTAVANPPLALDLHYLLTAFGSEDFHAEILLGYAMQLLHEHPVLTRDAIRTALAPPVQAPGGGGLPEALRVLSTSGLADQVEQIKIVPETLDVESISKLWAAFQTNYRPTAAYQVSVVLIERRRSTHSSLPVTRRNIMARQLGRPVIENLEPLFLGAGDVLTLHGYGLRAVPIAVRFDDVVAAPDTVTDSRIEATLPPGLPAGIRTVQVLHDLDFGTPTEPHRGFQSNAAAFTLRPDIVAGAPQNVTALGGGFFSADLDVTFAPEVGRDQRVVLLFNETPAPPPPQRAVGFSFDAPDRAPTDPDTQPTLTVPIDRIRAGTYLLRANVDAGESELQADALTGELIGPTVTFP
jgi:Pvc16 N-terminal domain/IPT/TIG domain